MSNPFFDRPIVNSPYEYPRQHWELDETGQPTGHLLERRRRAEFITPIPKPKKRRGSRQEELDLDEGKGLSTKKQAYDLTSIINEVRGQVDAWRGLPASQWQVTPETARLLHHWRHHEFGGVRPFFCQIEAVETAIWFTEVAPHLVSGKRLLDNLKAVNADANPQIERLALKLATGAGKTTVMAMLIAWQTLNAVRRPGSKHFTRGFLIVTPGLTIKDRLRVLQPNDPDSYYSTRDLIPNDLVEDIRKARIVITNYHAASGSSFPPADERSSRARPVPSCRRLKPKAKCSSA
jgi:type III restriction enzyme